MRLKSSFHSEHYSSGRISRGVLLCPMPLAIDSRVLCSSHDMELTSYDAMGHRTVLGGGHYRTNIHSGVEMAEWTE
jgi:hypothetical protein